MSIRDYWIGVDFDGTLAKSIYRTDPYQLGPPIPSMIARVQQWLSDGYRVKLMTARMSKYSHTLGVERDIVKMESDLRAWCKLHVGQELECTNEKDGLMLSLWDDRAVGVVKDTGEPLTSILASSSCPICGQQEPHNHFMKANSWPRSACPS